MDSRDIEKWRIELDSYANVEDGVEYWLARDLMEPMGYTRVPAAGRRIGRDKVGPELHAVRERIQDLAGGVDVVGGLVEPLLQLVHALQLHAERKLANLLAFHLFPHPYAASSVFQPIRSLGVQPRAWAMAYALSTPGTIEPFS